MSLLLDALKKAAQEKLEKQERNNKSPTDSAVSPLNDTASSEKNLELEPLESTQNSTDSDSTTEYNRKRSHVLATELEDFLNDDKKIPPQNTQAPNNDTNNAAFTSTTYNPNTYLGSPNQAEKLFGNKGRPIKKQRRFIVAICALSLVTLIVIVTYSYSYIAKMNSHSAIIKRTNMPTLPQENNLATTSSDIREETDSKNPILITQEDYELLFAEEQKPSATEYQERADSEQQIQFASTPSNMKTDSVSTPRSQKDNLRISKSTNADSIHTALLQAYKAYNENQYQDAKIIYTQVLNKEANNRDALLGIAAIHIIENNVQAAEKYYQEILRLNSKDDFALAALASLQTSDPNQQGDSKKTQLKSLLSEKPDSEQLHFALGNLYAKEKSWSKAQNSYFNAYRIAPKNANYNYNLAVSLDHLGQKKSALQFYKQALMHRSSTNTVSFNVTTVSQRITTLELEL